MLLHRRQSECSGKRANGCFANGGYEDNENTCVLGRVMGTSILGRAMRRIVVISLDTLVAILRVKVLGSIR
jgi:hypothetical protein